MRISVSFIILMLLVSSFLLLSGLGCNSELGPEDPDKCGPVINDSKRWSKEYNLNPADHYLYVEEGWANYDYSAGVYEDVCAHKHINGRFIINRKDEGDFIYRAEVVYGILYTYPVTDWDFEYDDGYTTAIGKFEFGIKNAYGNEPGWLLPTIRIFSQDYGSPEKNNEVFEERIYSLEVEIEFYEWKYNKP